MTYTVWLTYTLSGWLTHCFNDLHTDSVTYTLSSWLTYYLNDLHTELVTYTLSSWLTHCLNDLHTDLVTYTLSSWLTHCLNDLHTDLVTYTLIEPLILRPVAAIVVLRLPLLMSVISLHVLWRFGIFPFLDNTCQSRDITMCSPKLTWIMVAFSPIYKIQMNEKIMQKKKIICL